MGKKKKRKTDPDPSTTNSLILPTEANVSDVDLDLSTASLPPISGGGSPVSLDPLTSLPVRIDFVCVCMLKSMYSIHVHA